MSNSKAWENRQYIFNLATTLVGQKLIDLCKDGDISPKAFHERMSAGLTLKVREMTDESLGRICAYATKDGWDQSGNLHPTDFYNMTGLKDVLGIDSMPFKWGRQMLEELAVATICCIAFDSMLQTAYQDLYQAEAELNRQYDLVERDMAHGKFSGSHRNSQVETEQDRAGENDLARTFPGQYPRKR